MSTTQVKSFGTIYRRIRGGPESDIRLHHDTLQLVADLVPGKRVLDIGVGQGAFTYKLQSRHPRELWVTDYDPDHVAAAMEALSTAESNGCLRVPKRLDLCGDLGELGEGGFDLIVCISVLMHLPPQESARAIRKLAERLIPGGTLTIGVIARAVAEEVFIPAPSRGEHVFYPALTRLPEKPSEADIEADPEELSVLAEYYPPDSFYEGACLETGLQVRRYEAIAGEECLTDRRGRPGVYRCIAEKRAPLWKLWTITRPG